MNAHRPPARPAKHGKERGGTAYDTTDIVWGNRHGAAIGQPDAAAHPGGICGQEHLLGEGKILRQLIDQDRVSSMIFWGPPGVGKTTLARIIANGPTPISSISAP